MTMPRVGLIYDDRDRPETTGGYCLRALRERASVVHIRPDRAGAISPSDFDLFIRIDDGIESALPSSFRPLAWWAIDTHLDFERCRRQAEGAEWVFAAQRPGAEAFLRVGIAAEWLPLACDPLLHRPHGVPKRFDIGFVGNALPGPRTDLLELLRRHYPNHFFGRAYFEEMAVAYSACRLSFNRSVTDDLNMRVFEALACGSLLLTNALPESGQGEFFRDGIHFATYGDAEELLEKAAFYLSRAGTRTGVEQSGRDEVVARHTYAHRMERILATAAARSLSAAVSAQPPRAAPATSDVPAPVDPGYFEFERPELLALIPRAARDVVDVGCGAGRLGESLKARQKSRVVGIEQNPAAAAAARRRLDLVLEGDIETMDWPFPAGSFDAVICGDVLEHLRDPLAALRRMRTWLRPGGLLVASLPNVRHHSVIRGLLNGDWTYESAGLLDATHLRFFTRREIEKLLFRAGFRVPELLAVPGPGHAEWVGAGRPGAVRIGGLHVGPIEPSEAEEFYAYQWLLAAPLAEAPEPGLTSIVILTHNQLHFTRHCVESIRLVTDEPHELVFVDNGSSDGTPDYLRLLATSDPRVIVILNPDNRGFPAGVNQGIRASKGEQVLLLNNDTVATTGWLARMLRALFSRADVGIVGPCSNRVSGGQQVPVTYGDDLEGLDGFAWRFGRSRDGTVEETDRLVGFCFLIRRAVIDAIGPLDEGFGIGNFEDDDYCVRARGAGFRTVIARDSFVHHVGGATFVQTGIDYEALLRKNEERFREKWQGSPQAAAPGPKPELRIAPSQMSFTLRAGTGGLRLEPVSVGVSGCFIVRDNADTIRAALESLKPWVDELIVIDTGSKDDTPKIARELGARVFTFEWIDDFSAARNESVRHARGRWIFWMDSDDSIDETNGRGLRELARGPHADNVLGYVVQVHCPGPDGMDDLTVVDHVKLFRNRPDLRFDGRIHEQILPAIRQAGGDVAWTELFVLHSGYDHSPLGQDRKKERDLRILHRELAERPDHPFTLFNLGMTYADVGEFGGAAQYLERSLRTSEVGESHRRKAYSLLAHCKLRAGTPEDARQVCESGLRECPEDIELRFRLGVALHELGRLRESVAAYERVLAGTGARYFTSVDRGIAGYKARQNLAVVHGDLGEWDLAEAAWRGVVAEAPDYRTGWHGLGEVLLRGGRSDEVAGIAAALIANPKTAGVGHLLRGRNAASDGRMGEARNAWLTAADADSLDPEPLRLLAQTYFESGEDASAEQYLRALLALSPGDGAAYHNLGTLFLRSGRTREAVDALHRSLAARPVSTETLLVLGYALKEAGDRDGARTAWETILNADPNHGEARQGVGELG